MTAKKVLHYDPDLLSRALRPTLATLIARRCAISSPVANGLRGFDTYFLNRAR
jgi:hypothetical protein